MIDNPDLADILDTATDITTVVEIYHQDATPGDDGFDPTGAMACFAAIEVSFMGVAYQRVVSKIGGVSRSTGAKSNTGSVDFSNIANLISRFEFAFGFEGLIMVIRTLSRSLSTSLDTSLILFSGRCEKPKSGSKESLSVTANWILGGLDITVPRRKYTPEDAEGRAASDPEFEGFTFMPQTGITEQVRVRRGGLAGFFGRKKWVDRVLSYSSFSDVDANKPVPIVLGRVQIYGTHIGYTDVGAAIRIRTAFCDGHDGGIEGFESVRSLDANFPLSGTSYAEALGDIGALNGPDDPSWVAPGNYSRTAHIRGQADNSLVEDTDPAPDVVGIVSGQKMTIPDGSGDWTNDGQWTDNPAAHKFWLLTGQDYYNLDENWLDLDDATESYNFDAEQIIDKSLTDFAFINQ